MAVAVGELWKPAGINNAPVKRSIQTRQTVEVEEAIVGDEIATFRRGKTAGIERRKATKVPGLRGMALTLSMYDLLSGNLYSKGKVAAARFSNPPSARQ